MSRNYFTTQVDGVEGRRGLYEVYLDDSSNARNYVGETYASSGHDAIDRVTVAMHP